jgi:hypothetical protein
MSTYWYLGIDPGKSGAVALVGGGEVHAWKFNNPDSIPIAHRIEACICHLDDKFRIESEGICVIEKVHSMPKQGVASSFAFGRAFGEAIATIECYNLPYVMVSPAKWTREFITQNSKRSPTEKKRELQRAARQLFPDTQILTDTADAILLAEYARRHYAR